MLLPSEDEAAFKKLRDSPKSVFFGNEAAVIVDPITASILSRPSPI
jgi:hypothetical protein